MARCIVSRLLDKDVLTKDLDALSEALKPALLDDGWLATYLVAGKGVNEAKPCGGGNAVHPARRKAYVHARKYTKITTLIFLSTCRMPRMEIANEMSSDVAGIPPFDKAAEENAIMTLDDRFASFRKATPGGGSYMNEVGFASRKSPHLE